jgi:hypothetical protein
VKEGETWTITLDDNDYSYTAEKDDTAELVAEGLNTLISVDYSSILAGAVITITSDTLPTTSYELGEAAVEAGATVSGAPAPAWYYRLAPNQDASVQPNDSWSIKVGDTTVQYPAGGSDGLAEVIAGLAANMPAAYSASIVDNEILLTGGLSPMSIGPFNLLRANAKTFSSYTEDLRPHYSTATLALQGDWGPGQTWFITVNGTTYSHTSVSTTPRNEQKMTMVAAILATAINNDPDATVTAEASNSKGSITFTNKSDSPYDNFTVAGGRQGGALHALIDIDYCPPGNYSGLYCSPYVKLVHVDGSGNETMIEESLSSDIIDPGSNSRMNPFIDLVLDTAGTYEIHVGSKRTWPLGATYIEGVMFGMTYQLNVSLQQHGYNDNAVTLDGSRITITSGTGAGQQAIIQSYNAETKMFTLTPETAWSIIPDKSSQFELAALSKSSPVTDTYSIVLTRPLTGDETVTVNVTPLLTRTYDSRQAFDPTNNFGIHEGIQVEVDQATIVFNSTNWDTPQLTVAISRSSSQ